MRKTFTACVYARNAGKILLIHHKRFDMWLPVGGELEGSESPTEGAVRELFEETGLIGTFPAVKNAVYGSPPGLICYEEHDAGSKGIHMNFCFVMDVEGQEIVSDNSFYNHKWVTFQEAQELKLNQNVSDCLRIIEFTV